VLRLRTLAFIILGLGIFFVLGMGLSLLTGKAHPHELMYALIGVGEVAGVVAVLAITARRWAPWVAPMCFLATMKALFAAVFGFTVSAPRLVPSRAYAFEAFVLLGAVVALTCRFLVGPLRSRLDVTALVGAVVAVFWNMLIPQSNLWPVRLAVALLGIAQLADWVRAPIRRHGGRNSGDSHEQISSL